MNRHENYRLKRSAIALGSLTEVLLSRSVTAVVFGKILEKLFL